MASRKRHIRQLNTESAKLFSSVNRDILALHAIIHQYFIQEMIQKYTPVIYFIQ